LLANTAKVGVHLVAALSRVLSQELATGGVKEIRGQGLMLGIELARPCAALVAQCADHGLLISVTADTVIRLVPPLIMSTDEADEVVSILCPLVKQLLLDAA
jgi:acetylornithine aminotransferase